MISVRDCRTLSSSSKVVLFPHDLLIGSGWNWWWKNLFHLRHIHLFCVFYLSLMLIKGLVRGILGPSCYHIGSTCCSWGIYYMLCQLWSGVQNKKDHTDHRWYPLSSDNNEWIKSKQKDNCSHLCLCEVQWKRLFRDLPSIQQQNNALCGKVPRSGIWGHSLVSVLQIWNADYVFFFKALSLPYWSTYSIVA